MQEVFLVVLVPFFFNGDVSPGSVQGFGFGSEREPATAIQIANCRLKTLLNFKTHAMQIGSLCK